MPARTAQTQQPPGPAKHQRYKINDSGRENDRRPCRGAGFIRMAQIAPMAADSGSVAASRTVHSRAAAAGNIINPTAIKVPSA